MIRRRRPKEQRNSYARRERFTDYMLWIKTLPCGLLSMPGHACHGPIEADHGHPEHGLGEKCHDAYTHPACTQGHREITEFHTSKKAGPFVGWTRERFTEWRLSRILHTQRTAIARGIGVPEVPPPKVPWKRDRTAGLHIVESQVEAAGGAPLDCNEPREGEQPPMKKSAKPTQPTSSTCPSTASGGALKCVIDEAHTVHSTSTAGRRAGQYATWSAVEDGRIRVITYSHGKKMSEWFEGQATAAAEPVPHRPLTLEDEPEDEEADAAAIAEMDDRGTDEIDYGPRTPMRCGARRAGVPIGCQLFADHDGDHFACLMAEAGGADAGSLARTWNDEGENSWDVCGSRWSMNPSEKGPQRRTKSDQTICLRPGEHDGKHRGLNRFGNHMDEWEGDGARGGVSHPKTKIDLAAELLGRADNEPALTDACPKCGRELGEHDGTKCPKPVKATAAAASAPIGRLTRIGDHEVHAAAALFPMIGDAEWPTFLDDIRANGQRKRIVRIKVGSSWLILDGRNRLRACLEIGFEPKFRTFGDDPSDGTDPIAFVVSENVHRRHLNETQRAFVGAELVPMYEAQAKERQLAALKQNTVTLNSGQRKTPAEERGPTSAEMAARAVNVGKSSIEAALKVNRDATPEVIAASKDRGQMKVSTAAQLATLPKQKQREIVEKIGGGELRSGKVRSLVNQEKKRAVVREINEQRVEPAPLGPFGVIVIDPPWPYENSDQHEGSRGHLDYPTMSIHDLCDLRSEIESRSKEDCILGMWVTNAFIHEVGRILFAWGFDHRTMITWDKEVAGVGMLPRGQTEHLVIATRGAPVHTLNEITTMLRVRKREHSRKPDEMYELLAKHCAGPMIDMFAREQRPGWSTWGAETRKFATEAA